MGPAGAQSHAQIDVGGKCSMPAAWPDGLRMLRPILSHSPPICLWPQRRLTQMPLLPTRIFSPGSSRLAMACGRATIPGRQSETVDPGCRTNRQPGRLAARHTTAGPMPAAVRTISMPLWPVPLAHRVYLLVSSGGRHQCSSIQATVSRFNQPQSCSCCVDVDMLHSHAAAAERCAASTCPLLLLCNSCPALPTAAPH